MAELLTVLAQEQKTISHFRHSEKISIFFLKFFTIVKVHMTKQATLRKIMKLS
jgi:hypothetical protein